MRITALEEYGLRCLLTLSKVGQDGQMSISDIAEKEGLSIPYASKLLSILRKSGLVTAVRGRGGGFCIAREAKEINLLEAITALGGPLIDPQHCDKYSGQLDKCVHTDNCSVHYTLAGLAKKVGEFLASKSLDDVNSGIDLSSLMTIESKVSIENEDYTDELNAVLNETETKDVQN
jgi:Rrf2 family protein